MNQDHAERFGYPKMERPPVLEAGPLAWLRRNLFSNWLNSVLTVAMAAGLVALGAGWLRWSIETANWGVITSNIRVILWGRYPQEELWRPVWATAALAALALASWMVWRQPRLSRLRTPMVVTWLASPAALALLLQGFELPTLRTVGNNLGYYLFRPELLQVLDATWRGPIALMLVAAASRASRSLTTGRTARRLALLPALLVLGVNLPSAASLIPGPAGLPLPMAIPIAAGALVGWWIGGVAAGPLASTDRPGPWLAGMWLLTAVALPLILTTFDVGRPELDPATVLANVQPSLWSGIMLTMVLATLSIVLSFPLGVALALGRTSRLPVVRGVCVSVIEVVRGVPLITILFMAQVMLPMFLPLDLTIDRVVRAIAGMTIFTAAYLAEIVRGGLQAVPRDQLQAARALGLSEALVTLLVLLPQALRAVIPAILGQFVSIFKDTSLVSIVGLLDLLGILSSITKQREYLGTVREVFLFAALFYFVVSYGMSVASRRLEQRLGVGSR